MALIPIWKDKYVSLGANPQIYFRIQVSGATIYSGLAVAKPGELTISVRVNDICADWLTNALPTLTDRTFTDASYPSFVVQKYSGGSWVNVETIDFIPDWSFDYGILLNALADPINSRVDSRMFVLTSKNNITANVTASYTKANGTTTTRTTTISSPPKNGTCAFKANAVADTIQISVNGFTYEVVRDTCNRYCLYYVNAYGGWDGFLIEGNVTESDNYSRNAVEKDYDNTQLVNRGKENWLNEVTKAWTMHTGLLDDAQAGRMHHLIGSPLVYMCDLSTGDVWPVIVTDTACEYKTYKNQGNKMAEYTINVELAQNRIRR